MTASLYPWLDLFSGAFFFLGWMTYGRAVDNYKNPARPSLLTVMHQLRIKWLTEMQFRTLRMPDAMTLSITTSNYTFFASTSILIIAGAFTLLLRESEWQMLFGNIPMADLHSLQLTPVKLLLLTLIFVYSFFHFTWSIRQGGYCAVLLGSVANRYNANGGDTSPSAEEWEAARRLAEVLAPTFTLSGNNFNYGLRAYYFGLALLPWFVGPLWLLASSGLIIFVLWRREFHSKTLVNLLRAERELDRLKNSSAV